MTPILDDRKIRRILKIGPQLSLEVVLVAPTHVGVARLS